MIIIMIIIINNDTDNDLSRIYIKKSVKNVCVRIDQNIYQQEWEG